MPLSDIYSLAISCR